MILGLTITQTFYEVQVGKGEITDLGVEYLSIVTVFSLGIFMQIACERLLQATGKTVYTMCTQGLGAIINIIFDPILIFGLCGAPKMGIAGAAVATVLGQFVAAILALILNIKKNREIHITLKGFRPDGHIIRTILAVGIPSIIMQAIGSVMVFCFNKILNGFSSTAVAVFGVYFKLNSFVFMPVFGLNNGMVPIIAYNYGAHSRERMTKTIKYSVCYAVAIMIIGLAVIQIFPDKLLELFNASETMMSMGITALRIISLSFCFAGVCIVFSSVFQALGKGVISMLVSFVRQLVILLPAAYLLSLLGDVNLVWWSFIIAEVITVVFSSFMYMRVYNKIIKPL